MLKASAIFLSIDSKFKKIKDASLESVHRWKQGKLGEDSFLLTIIICWTCQLSSHHHPMWTFSSSSVSHMIWALGSCLCALEWVSQGQDQIVMRANRQKESCPGFTLLQVQPRKISSEHWFGRLKLSCDIFSLFLSYKG